jgi:hypothetical protein
MKKLAILLLMCQSMWGCLNSIKSKGDINSENEIALNKIFTMVEIEQLEHLISISDSTIKQVSDNKIVENYFLFINKLIKLGEKKGYYSLTDLQLNDKEFFLMKNSLDSSLFHEIWYPIKFNGCNTWEISINGKYHKLVEEITRKDENVKWYLEAIDYGGLQYGVPETLSLFKRMNLKDKNIRLLFIIYQITWRMQFECL